MEKLPCTKVLLMNFFILTFTLNIALIFIYTTDFRSTDVLQMKNIDIPSSKRMFNLSNFEYIISKSVCHDDHVKPLFINLVHSSPMRFKRRAACRETWAHSDSRTKTYFLLGAVELATIQRKIATEDAQYHDIIQGNFIDTYHNLTYKHTMALKWFTENCEQVQYLVKLDDDVFVNVPRVHEYLLRNKKDTKFLMGPYRALQEVHRDGKWAVSRNEFVDTLYPEYVEGSTVVYPNEFVREAYEKTFTTRFFWVDDVYVTGMIRMQTNTRIVPIEPYLLSGNALKAVLNGTTHALSNSTFLFSEQSLKPQDIRKLWNFVGPFRNDHQRDTE